MASSVADPDTAPGLLWRQLLTGPVASAGATQSVCARRVVTGARAPRAPADHAPDGEGAVSTRAAESVGILSSRWYIAGSQGRGRHHGLSFRREPPHGVVSRRRFAISGVAVRRPCGSIGRVRPRLARALVAADRASGRRCGLDAAVPSAALLPVDHYRQDEGPWTKQKPPFRLGAQAPKSDGWRGPDRGGGTMPSSSRSRSLRPRSSSRLPNQLPP